MTVGALFLVIVIVGFFYFATQFGSSRGPGSVKKDLLNLALFFIVCLVLFFLWSGAHVAMVVR